MEADLQTQFTKALKELINEECEVSEENKAKILSVLVKYSKKKKEPGLTREEAKEEIESYIDGLVNEIRVRDWEMVDALARNFK